MTEQWLIEDKLCSFDEKVRVELGPQVIELDCTDANLCDTVTHPHYRIGGRDAMGRIIRPDDHVIADKKENGVFRNAVAKDISLGRKPVAAGEMMACVDWKAKSVPHVWKIYVSTPTGLFDEEGDEIHRFEKLEEVEGKDKALAKAKKVYEGMK